MVIEGSGYLTGTALTLPAATPSGERKPGRSGSSRGWQDCLMTSRHVSLAGTSAIVTGASSGLGRAVAVRLAAEGANVALLGRSESDLEAVAEEVTSHSVRALVMPVDLADTYSMAGVVDHVARELGRLGVLVSAAATDAPGLAEDLTLADWERVVAVNLTAPFALTKAALPHLRSSGGGLVVNVSSVAGRRGWANASAYCATKFALTGLTQALAAEGRPDGIRVCVLYPGSMDTGWGTFESDRRAARGSRPPADPHDALDPATVADLIAWMATAPGQPVLNEVTMTPLREGGWP